MGALARRVRADAGKAQAMRDGLLAALSEQYRNFPHWSYQLHADNLMALVGEKPELGEAPSYSTVRRRMKARGWTKKRRPKTPGQRLAAERLEKREVRSSHSELGCIGKNNLLINPTFGPRIRLRSFGLDTEIPSDGVLTFAPCKSCGEYCRKGSNRLVTEYISRVHKSPQYFIEMQVRPADCSGGYANKRIRILSDYRVGNTR